MLALFDSICGGGMIFCNIGLFQGIFGFFDGNYSGVELLEYFLCEFGLNVAANDCDMLVGVSMLWHLIQQLKGEFIHKLCEGFSLNLRQEREKDISQVNVEL